MNEWSVVKPPVHLRTIDNKSLVNIAARRSGLAINAEDVEFVLGLLAGALADICWIKSHISRLRSHPIYQSHKGAAQRPALVIIRHGERCDYCARDKGRGQEWVAAQPRPWDTSLTDLGKKQVNSNLNLSWNLDLRNSL